MIGRFAVSTAGLVKCYGFRRALDDLTLDVPYGGILGLVGPNGAGKTTWMMAVVGLVRIDEGRIALLGPTPFDAALHSGRVSILPQDSELPLEETPFGFLSALGRAQGLSGEKARESARRILESVALSDRANVSIRSLSHGMRKRLMVAQCFLGDPELVLLDEPFNGLDPEQAASLRSFVKNCGKTVVISTHHLDDVEKLCSHVAFVAKGQVTACAPIDGMVPEGETLEDVYLRQINSFSRVKAS